MIAVKLLSVRVLPTFVLVDTDTGDVEPGPQVQPADLKASDLGQLADLLEQARQQVEQQANTRPPIAARPEVDQP